MKEDVKLYCIECSIVASVWNKTDTINWYRNKLGYEIDEPLDVSLAVNEIDLDKIKSLDYNELLKEPKIIANID